MTLQTHIFKHIRLRTLSCLELVWRCQCHTLACVLSIPYYVALHLAIERCTLTLRKPRSARPRVRGGCQHSLDE
jgi:hypothetical protein